MEPQPGNVASLTTPAKLLDVDEVATLLGCSPRHVHRLVASGRMPEPMKLGSLARWARTVIESWIATGCMPVCGDGVEGGSGE
jgi:excisionase family DNA binding protein